MGAARLGAGVHPGGGSVLERDHRDARGDSRIELLRGSLQVGEVSNLEMPDQAADTVVMQNPRPGAGAATPRVDVLVSAGPHENAFVMPHLVGLNEEEAQRRLEASGIKRR